MKKYLWIVFLLSYIVGFAADHSFIDNHDVKNNVKSKTSFSEKTNKTELATTASENSHSEENDCTDCVLGFCAHFLTLPIPFNRELSITMNSEISIANSDSFYQSPFYSSPLRPPIL